MELMDISLKNGDVNDLIDKLNLLDMKSKKLQENILHSFNRNMYSKNTHASNLIKEYNKILEKYFHIFHMKKN